MKYKWLLSIILISFIVQRCAKQTSPTGGPKDETPPKLIRSTPAHEQVNFSENEIELIFDELVQLNNPRDQIIITPSVGKKIEATAKKNKIDLNLNTTLQPNTTYTINFRESIQDLTEKNPSLVKIAFSTGMYIDSLSISGTVDDILLNQEAANYTVALTQATDTFNIFTHSAPWITLTNKQGVFILENLKHGEYFIYAFDDRNKNLIVDGKSEKYGFNSEILVLNKNLDSLQLYTYKLDALPLRLISARPTFSYFNIKLSKSITDYSLESMTDSIKLYSLLDDDLSSIKVYNSLSNLDSLQVRLKAKDSILTKIDTLLYMKFNKKESTKDKFSATIESCNLFEDNSTLTAVISISKPMFNFNSDSIYIQLDSVTRTTFTKNDFAWDKSRTKLTLSLKYEKKDAKIEPKKREDVKTKSEARNDQSSDPSYNKLILAKGSLISIENDTATQLISPIKIVKENETGIIITRVESTENFILQLLNNASKVIAEVKNGKEYQFKNLPPGSYRLRLLIDKNKNGVWEAGDYSQKTFTEPVIFYKNPKNEKDINIKANWTVGPLLITY